MATNAHVPARVRSSTTSVPPLVILLAAWLIPGSGHLLQKMWIRGTLLFLSIFFMFVIGIALQGKIYTANTGELLDMLNFAGDLGTGLLYLLSRVFDLGATAITLATADYGTKFIVVAGLLNIIAAVDAHSLASGRKRS